MPDTATVYPQIQGSSIKTKNNGTRIKYDLAIRQPADKLLSQSRVLGRMIYSESYMKRACSLNTNTDVLERSVNPRSEYLTCEFHPAIKKQIIYG